MKFVRSLFAERGWHYSFGFDWDIDFCFWVLERDGLRVSPFDRHPDGDGTLRAAGLDAAAWRDRLKECIRAHEERRQTRTASITRHVDFARLGGWEPAAIWDGESAVGQRLTTLAEEYYEIVNEREKDKLELANVHAQCDHQLWRDLAPFRRTLPPVRIVTVAYPGPVLATVAPDTILLAVGDWKPAPSELASAILDGMRALAATA